jgi:hypothetical protein
VFGVRAAAGVHASAAITPSINQRRSVCITVLTPIFWNARKRTPRTADRKAEL